MTRVGPIRANPGIDAGTIGKRPLADAASVRVALDPSGLVVTCHPCQHRIKPHWRKVDLRDRETWAPISILPNPDT